MHSKIKFIIVLEVLACALALLHVPAGVLTDEAKYLLSIPYPHPPLLRGLIGLTSELPGHAFLWRFLFASIAMQASWIVWDLSGALTREKRIALLSAWILSAAVLTQSGAILIVVPTAVFGLLFVRYSLLPEAPSLRSLPLLGLVWLAGLMSSYQAVLFVPLVFTSMLRTGAPLKKTALYLLMPLAVLALYSLSNPLALNTIVQVSGQDAVLPWATRAWQIFWIWAIGGSIIASTAGIWGILQSKRFDLISTVALLLLYITLTSQQYYAMLLTPLFVAGCHQLFLLRRLPAPIFMRLRYCSDSS